MAGERWPVGLGAWVGDGIVARARIRSRLRGEFGGQHRVMSGRGAGRGTAATREPTTAGSRRATG